MGHRRGSLRNLGLVALKPHTNAISNRWRFYQWQESGTAGPQAALPLIRVNSVLPGGMATPGRDKMRRMQATGGPRIEGPATIPGRNLLGRLADPVEIARAVLFPASGAASYITGVELLVDGGFTKGRLMLEMPGSSSPPIALDRPSSTSLGARDHINPAIGTAQANVMIAGRGADLTKGPAGCCTPPLASRLQ